jgi:rRNA maturation endonuclease Nob1
MMVRCEACGRMFRLPRNPKGDTIEVCPHCGTPTFAERLEQGFQMIDQEYEGE